MLRAKSRTEPALDADRKKEAHRKLREKVEGLQHGKEAVFLGRHKYYGGLAHKHHPNKNPKGIYKEVVNRAGKTWDDLGMEAKLDAIAARRSLSNAEREKLVREAKAAFIEGLRRFAQFLERKWPKRREGDLLTEFTSDESKINAILELFAEIFSSRLEQALWYANVDESLAFALEAYRYDSGVLSDRIKRAEEEELKLESDPESGMHIGATELSRERKRELVRELGRGETSKVILYRKLIIVKKDTGIVRRDTGDPKAKGTAGGGKKSDKNSQPSKTGPEKTTPPLVKEPAAEPKSNPVARKEGEATVLPAPTPAPSPEPKVVPDENRERPPTDTGEKDTEDEVGSGAGAIAAPSPDGEKLKHEVGKEPETGQTGGNDDEPDKVLNGEIIEPAKKKDEIKQTPITIDDGTGKVEGGLPVPYHDARPLRALIEARRKVSDAFNTYYGEGPSRRFNKFRLAVLKEMRAGFSKDQLISVIPTEEFLALLRSEFDHTSYIYGANYSRKIIKKINNYITLAHQISGFGIVSLETALKSLPQEEFYNLTRHAYFNIHVKLEKRLNDFLDVRNYLVQTGLSSGIAMNADIRRHVIHDIYEIFSDIDSKLKLKYRFSNDTQLESFGKARASNCFNHRFVLKVESEGIINASDTNEIYNRMFNKEAQRKRGNEIQL